MMSEEERKKVFWLLKKYSSYTAWKALGDAYAEFAKAYEYAIQHSEETDEDASEWDRDHFKRILDGQIAFEKGLPLLREGQRSVFRNTSMGYLARAANQVYFAGRIMDPDEYVFDWMKNKDEVLATFETVELHISGLFSARDRQSPNHLQPFGTKPFLMLFMRLSTSLLIFTAFLPLLTLPSILGARHL